MASQSASQELDLENVGMHVEASYEKTLRLRVKELLNCSNENFPGSFPVMLDKEKISLLQEEDYFVCEKSDGVRYMMLSTYTALGPATFLIDRNNTYRYIESFLLPSKDNPGKYHHETLLDGELVINRDRETKQKTLKYLVFDLMVCNANVIARRPLTSRLGLLRQEIIDPFEQSLLNPEVSKKVPFLINLKRVERSYGLNLILASLPLLDHPSDGLIFTPVSLPYRSGSCSKLLKWKPAEHNTADLRIHVTHNSDRKPVYQLQVASGVTNKIFSPLQLPPDIYTKWRSSPPEGKIAEFRWDPTWPVTTTEKGYAPQTVKGGWVFVRLRPDKKAPNDETTARNAIRAIEDGVSRESLEEATETMRTRWKERERGQDGNSLPSIVRLEPSKPLIENIESKDANDSLEETKSDIVFPPSKPNVEKQNGSSPKPSRTENECSILDHKGPVISSPRVFNDGPKDLKLESQEADPPSKDLEKSVSTSLDTQPFSNGTVKATVVKMETDEQDASSKPLVSHTEALQTDSVAPTVSDAPRSKSEAQIDQKSISIPRNNAILNIIKTEPNHKEEAKRAGSVSILEYHTPRKISRRQLSDSNIDIEHPANFPRDTSAFSKNAVETNKKDVAPISQEKITDFVKDSTDSKNVKPAVSAAKSPIQPSTQPESSSADVVSKKDLETNIISDKPEVSADAKLFVNNTVSRKNKNALPISKESASHIQPQNGTLLHAMPKATSVVASASNGHEQKPKIFETKNLVESPTTTLPSSQPPKRSSNLFSLMSTNSEPVHPTDKSLVEVNDPAMLASSHTQTPPGTAKVLPENTPQTRLEMESTPSFIRPSNPPPQATLSSGSMDLSELTNRSSVENGSSVPDKRPQGKKTSRIADLLNGTSGARYETPYDKPIAPSRDGSNSSTPLFSPPIDQQLNIHTFKETKASKKANIVGSEPPLQPRTASTFRHGHEAEVLMQKVPGTELVQDNPVNPNNIVQNPSRLPERPSFNEQMPSRPPLRPSRPSLRSDSSQSNAYMFGSMNPIGSRPPVMAQSVASSQPILTHQQAVSREASVRRGSNSTQYYRPPYPEPGPNASSAASLSGLRRSSLSQSGWVNGRPEPYPTQPHHNKFPTSSYPGIPGRPVGIPTSSVASGGSSNGPGISMYSRPGSQPSLVHAQGHPQGHPQGHSNHPQGYPLGHPQGLPQGYPQGHHQGHQGHVSGHPQVAHLQNLPQGFHPGLSQPPASNHPQGTLQGLTQIHHGQSMRPKTYTTLPPSQITLPQSYPNLPHSQPFPPGYNQSPQYQFQQQPISHHQNPNQMYPSRPFQSPQAHTLPPNQNPPSSQPLPGQPPGSSIPPTTAPPPPSRQSKGMLDFIMNP